jgi:hypothetical protein
VNAKDTRNLEERKARVEERLNPSWQPETASPVLGGSNAQYEMAGRTTAMPCGGIGLVHEFVRSIGLAEAIDARLELLQAHRPYHESDHVLNMAYNICAGGTCLEDIELLRNDEGYLDVLGARRIPDPTTAGDFLRRFDDCRVHLLMEAINEARTRVWSEMPHKQRELALIDVDGTIAPTLGECKKGMDISYKGQWGYAPLIVSLANTQEVLYIKNRPGNEVSHCDAPAYMDAAIDLVRSGEFRRVRLRGDTDFSLTGNFDRWTEDGVEFVFGMDANPSFKARAEQIPESAWQRLHRPAKYFPDTGPRQRPENVKQEIVVDRGYKNLVLKEEHVAELEHSPAKCDHTYRLIVLRKTISVCQGQMELYDDVRYFFYVTNVPRSELPTKKVVFEANARCHQENIIEQMKNGVKAMRLPSDSLPSNWAYMVIAALAWNLKAWLSICIPLPEESREIRRMEWRRFLNTLMLVPCQVVRTGRRVVVRILRYTSWVHVLLEAMHHFRTVRLASS